MYTPISDIILQPFSKKIWAIKDINKLLLHVNANFQADWFGTVENRSDSKSISDSGVMSDSESNKT